MTYKEAKREATPAMIAFVGTSGSGKTFSALLMAAGLAGASGKVGFIDTELGRGSMYADDPEIKAAMPNGKYFIKNLTEPFTPAKYMAAIKEAIEAKIDVLIIDSISHEWEGVGGCCDIAENNKLGGLPNWAKAKLEHKKLINMVSQSPMHIIFCVRAREKSKPGKDEKGRTVMIDCGLQPIQEKHFKYDMTLMFLFTEEQPGVPKMFSKCPKPLRDMFGDRQSLITKTSGERLRAWSDGGASVDMQLRNLAREFREAAAFGDVALKAIHARVGKENPDLLKKVWSVDFADEVKNLAKEADDLTAAQANEEEDNKEQEKLFKGNE